MVLACPTEVVWSVAMAAMVRAKKDAACAMDFRAQAMNDYAGIYMYIHTYVYMYGNPPPPP